MQCRRWPPLRAWPAGRLGPTGMVSPRRWWSTFSAVVDALVAFRGLTCREGRVSAPRPAAPGAPVGLGRRSARSDRGGQKRAQGWVQIAGLEHAQQVGLSEGDSAGGAGRSRRRPRRCSGWLRRIAARRATSATGVAVIPRQASSLHSSLEHRVHRWKGRELEKGRGLRRARPSRARASETFWG